MTTSQVLKGVTTYFSCQQQEMVIRWQRCQIYFFSFTQESPFLLRVFTRFLDLDFFSFLLFDDFTGLLILKCHYNVLICDLSSVFFCNLCLQRLIV